MDEEAILTAIKAELRRQELDTSYERGDGLEVEGYIDLRALARAVVAVATAPAAQARPADQPGR